MQAVLNPFLVRSSIILSIGFPKESTPMALLYVFWPVARAVPPAAESVVKSSEDCVFKNPIAFNWVSVSLPPLAKTALEIWASPFPSPISKITFCMGLFFLSDK